MDDLIALFQRGGPVMVPILALSVVALCVFLERLYSLRKKNVVPEEFRELCRKKLSNGLQDETRILCEGNRSALSAVLAAGLKHKGRSRAEIKEAFEEAGQFEVAYFGRFIELLGTLASVGPLLGLLGTVTGMIEVFRAVVADAGAGPINPVSLADGIWGALLTTAAGLTAAIPAFLGYKYLLSRLDRLTIELEEAALEMLDLIRPPAEHTQAPQVPLKTQDSESEAKS